MTHAAHRTLAVTLLLMFLLSNATAGKDTSTKPADRIALDFQARTLDGRELQLSSLQGKVVLLNFWGIWCIPCRKEIPKLQAMYEELHDQGLEIIGIDVGDEAETVRKFVAQQSMSYPVILSEAIADDYNVEVFPTNVIIDRLGRIHHVEEGYEDGTTAILRDIIERLLAQKSPGTGGTP